MKHFLLTLPALLLVTPTYAAPSGLKLEAVFHDGGSFRQANRIRYSYTVTPTAWSPFQVVRLRIGMGGAMPNATGFWAII